MDEERTSCSPPDKQPVVLPRDAHPISRKSIDPDALKILYRLHRFGFTAYLYSNRKLATWLIDAAYQLVFMVAAGVILAVW